jgi:predicted RNase H-like nuclease
LPKIAEIDRLMTPDRQRHLVEVHPEVCFTVLAGGPMSHHKATPQGRVERLTVLRGVFSDIDARADGRLPGTQPDDILDAYVAAWTAGRWFAQTHIRLGGDLDARGLRMEMIA